MSDESMPIIAVAEIFGISGRRSELAALLTVTEQHARDFPGARRYVFPADLETPDQFVLVSEWDSHDAMAAYHRSQQFARYQFQLHGLVARASEMTVYSVTDAVRPVTVGREAMVGRVPGKSVIARICQALRSRGRRLVSACDEKAGKGRRAVSIDMALGLRGDDNRRFCGCFRARGGL